MLVLRNPPVLHELLERRQLINTVDCLLFSQTFFKFLSLLTEWGWSVGNNKMQKVIGNEHAGQRLSPWSIESCLFIIFSRVEYNWSWTRIYRGRRREWNVALELQVCCWWCCCCCFSFSLPLAPFYSRSRRVCYPVVRASRKPQAVCVPQTEEVEKRRRRKKKNPFHSAFEPFFSFSLQPNHSTFSLFFHMYSWIRCIITICFFFLIFFLLHFFIFFAW